MKTVVPEIVIADVPKGNRIIPELTKVATSNLSPSSLRPPAIICSSSRVPT